MVQVIGISERLDELSRKVSRDVQSSLKSPKEVTGGVWHGRKDMPPIRAQNECIQRKLARAPFYLLVECPLRSQSIQR